MSNSSHTGASETCTIETERPSDGLIITRLSGYANAVLAARMRNDVMEALVGSPVDWVADATAVSKIDRAIIEPFAELLRDFKTRGGGRVLVVPNDGIRLMLSTIALSAATSGGATLEMVDTLQVALMHLGRLVEPKAGAS